MPEHLRRQMLQFGYPKDEYTRYGNWSPQLYVREARRMKGAYVMTQANCQGREVVPDGVGMAAYAMDSHNCQRIVVNGMVKNEGDVQIKDIQPYPIAYRSLTPNRSECTNLLVPVCLSASHMAYGSIRMEPVFMVLAQSAAHAASLAFTQKKAVQDISVPALQKALKANPLADGTEPEVLVDNDDTVNVVRTGTWKRETGGYGPSYLSSRSGDSASVRFLATLRKTGTYTVYAYFPRTGNMADQFEVRIQIGNSSPQKKIIRKDDIRVMGQTSGEWVALGSVSSGKGDKGSVEISAAGANGTVVADAVLFVPVK